MCNKKSIVFLFLGIFLSGCATVTSQQPSNKIDAVEEFTDSKKDMVEGGSVIPGDSPKIIESSLELKGIRSEDLDEYVHSNGVVFAKVEVLGVLKSDFLSLIIEDREDRSFKYQLFIGEAIGSQFFPWEGKDRNEAHFFIELPVGKYIISSVGIPVGSTMAFERLDVLFEVIPGAITYLGTLKLVGTKERVRLGGVPVIKPGFEYTKEIINEKEKAALLFYQKYPNFQSKIIENIMVAIETNDFIKK